mmetsp:Transcript_876/g.1488  ORF Transcript_876/g.1488 Transcript_876/m.1488 type:complete len:492 (-) Transcript_876:99-1574(-)
MMVNILISFFIFQHCIGIYQVYGSYFSNNSKVCFLGDSITHMGDFHHNIFQFYITRYADTNITFCNCGIAGDTATGLLKRMDDDVFIHNPTHAVIMLGMNDLGADYLKDTSGSKKKSDLLLFTTSMEKIIKQLQEKNIHITLQKPSIYDQTVQTSTPNMIGRNDVLFKVALIINDIGKKHNLQVVDYWTIMRNLNMRLQKLNPSDTVVSLDRIHPGPPGHMVMAYKFLNTTEKPSVVSHMVLGEDAASSQRASSNCLVHSLIRPNNSKSKDGEDSSMVVEAVISEQALPFVIADDQRKALGLVPFVKDFNTELLQVLGLGDSGGIGSNPGGLKPSGGGDYKLSIDGVKVGVFSGAALAFGVNLALHKRTPQYLQAIQVRQVLMKLWAVEQMDRRVKYVEHQFMKPFYANRSMFAADVNFMEAEKYLVDYIMESSRKNLNQSFTHYLKFKREEANLEVEMQSLRTQARALAAPKPHTYTLERARQEDYDHHP